MSSYEKLMEMDGDEVYSLAKDKYYTVIIKCNAVYLEEKGRAPFKQGYYAALGDVLEQFDAFCEAFSKGQRDY